MNASTLKKFAQQARTDLQEQVSSKLKFVLAPESQARREFAKSVSDLESAIKKEGQSQVIERIAYTWFNRFCALRFMDVNEYTKVKVVSPREGQTQPEILADAKQGVIDPSVPLKTKDKILELLNGTLPSTDPDGEAYRLLLVASCNDWNASMPFMFQRIEDYTELLMPDNLLSQQSILADTRNAMTAENCEDVEVIGWLYQFYISERKKQVQDSKEKYVPETIPAATQLFTPHWIVRYLVENSLGRLWMLNHPESKLVEKMEYYIKPEEPESDFLKISSPEELKVCDPACGSGHILSCAFDLLYAIYEEEGYPTSEIPQKILTNNIFGVEIDPRAGTLANFALVMKARGKYRRFFRKKITPNICVLENVTFSDQELHDYAKVVGTELFNTSLKDGLKDFEQADNFGSLIQPNIGNVTSIREQLDKDTLSEDIFLFDIHNRVKTVLNQSEYLGQRYHVVVANPPYMGGKWMNVDLAKFAKKNYPNSKSHMSSMFIERNLKLTLPKGYSSKITMQSWMFLYSNKGVRTLLLDKKTIISLAHFGPHAFDSIGGEVVSTVAFVIQNSAQKYYKGDYLRLIDGKSEKEKITALKKAIQNPDCGWFYRSSADDFINIPGSPISYWLSEKILSIFKKVEPLSHNVDGRVGLMTSDNDRFIRFFWELSFESIFFKALNDQDSIDSLKTWFPHNKGGRFRKWAGNYYLVVDWYNRGERIKSTVIKKYPYLKGDPNFVVHDDGFYFKEFISWSEITTNKLSFRYFKNGFTSNVKGMLVFPSENVTIEQLLALLNSKFTNDLSSAINPTLSFGIKNLYSIPSAFVDHNKIRLLVNNLVIYAKQDWDSYETSWDFTTLNILSQDHRQSNLLSTYSTLRDHWNTTTLEMQKLEEENNRIFIEAYGLEDELTPDVPLAEITLICNPHYRYSKSHEKTQEELDALLLCDTMKEFVSYAVGCMFGRYSIDEPGLILANQGETIEDFNKKVPNSQFQVDSNNVLPILDVEWFTDDIVDRFKNFLKITFGEEHYAENLKFIEDSLNIKNKKSYTIRDYFNKEFYKDHCQTYKKRPIYWLFSSPKGSFQALIYMHRYKKDTVSVVLNDYLREFRTKLTARKTHLESLSNKADTSKQDKAKALKETTSINKIITELNDYEKDILFPLAGQQIEIDLDDGVKVNYAKFGKALKKI